ncbi:MAG: SAM-dependent chlorinase/fluorinase [Candidatus Eisenbacteria bacterium]|nr:SAM-dependent chlorinase/fluorinase [Candidatus Eisenbacteria bacterium]
MRPPCGVVTLTTDFGIEDSYVGTMKGVGLRIFPEIRIVDITHHVAPTDVLEASLVLESSYPYFPVGAVHVAVVDPGVGTNRRPILVVAQDHYFVGPDNGTFTRILESGTVEAVFVIENPSLMLADISNTFHGRDVFAPAAAYVARGVAPSEFGRQVSDAVRVALPEPKIYANQLAGEVVYIDSFGNVITNISKKQFDENVGRRAVRIRLNGKVVDQVHRSYLEGPQGRLLALFGSSNLLELAVAGGRADRRIGAGKGDTVFVDVLDGEERPAGGFDY